VAVAPGFDGDRPRLGERLRRQRRERFVGRAAELALFQRLLGRDRPDFCVLWVHGPGGVGKTALCGVFAEVAQAAGRAVRTVDAREIELTSAGLGSAIGEPAPGQVTIVDSFERCAPLEGWLRESLLPRWPADALLVLAGRLPPSAQWLGDTGWHGLLHPLPLRNLGPDESREFLRTHGIVGAQQESVVESTHGHPLALALMVEALAGGDPLTRVRVDQEPELVRTLLERIVERAPGPRERAALEVCAHVRVTTEETLAEVLGEDDAPRLFEWLRRRSFIEHGPHGLVPHDLARDVLDADLRWRNPSAYRRLHRAARAATLRRIQNTEGVDRQRALFDFMFLHRTSAIMGAFQDWETFGTVYPAAATAQMLPEILAMVRRYEGPESATIAARWYAAQPHAFSAFLDPAGDVVGFSAAISLDQASAEEIDADPAARAAIAFVRRYGPPRPGEEILHHRFYISRDTYQKVSAGTNLFAITSAQHWITRPRLAWTFIAVADPDYWQDLFSYLNFQRSDEADFVVGRRYAVYSHDWRAEPMLAWSELMEERELARHPDEIPPPSPQRSPALVVLSEQEFRAAVRQALRAYTRPDALATNPLLRSRVIVETAGRQPRPEDLRRVLAGAAESLRANPRDEKLFRALHRTYLQPAASQELAAQALGLPFSTYRAHLTAGIDRIAGMLWQRELSGLTGGA
jgi:hypothetical protein